MDRDGEHAVIQAAALQALESDPLESLQIDTRLMSDGMIGQVTESVGKWTHSLQSWIEKPSAGKTSVLSFLSFSPLILSCLFLLSFFSSSLLLFFFQNFE